MAHSYYSPRRVRRHSISDVPDRATDDELTGDLEQSIFIFPSPTSSAGLDPPSPLSIPTDVSFPTTTTSTMEGRGRGRRTSSATNATDWTAMSFSGRSASVDTRTSLRSPLVELWEMSDDAQDEGAGGDATARVSAPLYTAGRYQQRSPLRMRPRGSQFAFSDGRFQLRARKESSVSSINSEKNPGAESPLSPTRIAPASRLPLLAFFSSLLSVEDGTMHLLTRPSLPHTSPLFPSSRLQPSDHTDAILDEKRAYFALDETTSLKAGMRIATDPSATAESPFALPLPFPAPHLPFVHFMNFVKDLCGIAVPKTIRLRAPAA